MATLREAIAIARPVIGDARAPNYRYSDSRLLGYANDALDVIAIARPALFRAVGEVECVANLAIQTVPMSDSNGLVDVMYVKGGNAVTPADRETLTRLNPGWMTMTPAAAKHWSKLGDDPNRFLVYPPAPAGQVLVVLYNQVPREFSVDEDIEIPASYVPAIANYVIAMAESANDPSVNSGRAAQFMQAFLGALGLSAQGSAANHKPEQK